ncbi:uncharacterized protein GGS22DRAFT_167096 [Annulohypoxylon maeteangense]|uniref:uncharacterized protein n=1 Tax=Annulohypoxylon maeteangense TaxID=1927788 RepID=UPI002008D89D|nr:uncharacterized protein GGS22DRAFT_167096 [Annulohypoxylon maeteangense]KAI0883487.1 hypothetical protein GGS22DRAFT_167096 [Annulohypoxylon maeteangense]
MRHFRCICLIPTIVHLVGAFGNFHGGSNGFGFEGARGHAPSIARSSDQNGFGGKGGSGFANSQGNGQSNTHGPYRIDSIVNAINSADEQVHTVNLAIRSIKTGGTIEHLDSTLQSLTSTIKTTSHHIAGAESFKSEDVRSLKAAIQPLHKSIGSLVTQLVARKDTIARLCGCRAVQGAVNQIRSSTRVMFDGIKNHIGSGSSAHGIQGRHGFSDLHSLDSGIASFLNHGSNAFSFGNCIDAGNAPAFTSFALQATPTFAAPPETVGGGLGPTAPAGPDEGEGEAGNTFGPANTDN